MGFCGGCEHHLLKNETRIVTRCGRNIVHTFPLLAWSNSSDSNRLLKFPAPKPCKWNDTSRTGQIWLSWCLTARNIYI